MEWKSEALTELFEPLVLTPEQYYGERRDDSALLCSNKDAHAGSSRGLNTLLMQTY
jgi:hypothetical protein